MSQLHKLFERERKLRTDARRTAQTPAGDYFRAEYGLALARLGSAVVKRRQALADGLVKAEASLRWHQDQLRALESEVDTVLPTAPQGWPET